MPSWLSILIPVAVAAATVAVNAAVNIKIKFAPDADTAARELKALALRVLQWALNLAMVAMLVIEVLSAEPLTRLAVFTITLNVTILGLVVTFYVIHRVLTVVRLIVKAQLRHAEVTGGIQDVLRTLPPAGP
jgi:hypothetical protein